MNELLAVLWKIIGMIVPNPTLTGFDKGVHETDPDQPGHPYRQNEETFGIR
jgi:hypothetical protein